MSEKPPHALYCRSAVDAIIACTCNEWELEIVEWQAREQILAAYEQHLSALGIGTHRWKNLLQIGWDAMVDCEQSLSATPAKFALAECLGPRNIVSIQLFETKEEAAQFTQNSDTHRTHIYLIDLDDPSTVWRGVMAFDRWISVDKSSLLL